MPMRSLVGLAFLLLASCEKPRSDYTLHDFANLRWLEGSWRGQIPKGGYFYETYRLLDDSTLAMRGYEDSTFNRANDSTDIMLRGGRIIDRSSKASYAATRVDTSRVEFAPGEGATNHFSWVRQSPDRWTATLHPAKGDTVAYPMVRVHR
jgi:hypothetical protein